MPGKGGKVRCIVEQNVEGCNGELVLATPAVETGVSVSAPADIARVRFADLRSANPMLPGETKADYKRRVHGIMAEVAGKRNLLAPSVLASDLQRGLFLSSRVLRKGGGVDYRLRPVPAMKEANPVDTVLRGFTRLTPEQRERAIDRIASL